MASYRPISATRDDRLHCPDLKTRIGEDPARYLDQPTTALARARIRGITTEARLDAFLEVETQRLPDHRDDCPRQKIIAAINLRRKAYFNEDTDLTPEEYRKAGMEPSPHSPTDGVGGESA